MKIEDIREKVAGSGRLLPLTYALLFLSLLLLFSVSKGVITRFHGVFLKQLVWMVAGITGMLLVRKVDYRDYHRYSGLLYALLIVLLMAVLVIGGGRASRWIRIGWFNFQPSEFGKLVLIFTLSSYLSERDASRFGTLLVGMLILGFPFLLVMQQPNLGTAFVFLVIFMAILFQAGCTRKQFAVMATVVLLASPLLWFSMKGYQRERILTFLNPLRDPLGRGYNLLQSKITIGSGGLIGKGFLKGTQTKLAFLPEYHTDFIFCVMGEEFGFVGVLLLLALYYFLLAHIVRITFSTQERFGRLVCTGILAMFFSQVFINVGMTIGIFPVAGIPLPFLSYGGSSLMVSLLAVGILANIHENATMF